MSNHTPGPWAINADFTGQVKTYHPHDTANEKWIADCNPEDANIIAATPELLSALKYWFDSKADPKVLAEKARAAIAKAEGYEVPS